ncbi:MAG: 16S rRNA (cytidine(1402)-2'-O)-methyltransferase [Betaproteobacteria bacterium]|nr:16S rRNA (cytidine(1402)-2'-O)-methyltransferase [Betaproteobacteria bacterium]
MEHAAAHRKTDGKPKGTLYVVATPIGNLRDISLRALDVLKQVAVVAAEDTRVTAKLLNHYGIGAKLTALHEHNEKRAVLALLEQGDSVALVSDAGTPGISDPGAQLTAAARAVGYTVTPVPGASAVVAALSAAGIAVSHFLFYGFLPARAAERRRELARLAAYPFTLVFFEAPHRVADSVADMRAALGAARRIVIARELTKLFETIHACPLAEAVDWLNADDHRRKGEFVLIVEGAFPGAADGAEAQRALEVLLAELPLKQAVALATRITGAKRNELYQLALKIKGEQQAASGEQ